LRRRLIFSLAFDSELVLGFDDFCVGDVVCGAFDRGCGRWV
jgi:hypothetical protein